MQCANEVKGCVKKHKDIFASQIKEESSNKKRAMKREVERELLQK